MCWNTVLSVFSVGNMLGPLVSSAPCNICASLLASYYPKSVLFSKYNSVCFMALLRVDKEDTSCGRAEFCLSSH